MNKLRLFYIYKFESARLKEYNYNITITSVEARQNGELVSVGDSQVLRTIRKIQKTNFTNEKIDSLKEQKNKLKNSKNNMKNTEILLDIQEKIDNLLFIPEYISVVINSKSDYRTMIKNKLIINGEKFVRLICGAGHARKNTVIFCAEKIAEKLKETLRNGINPKFQIARSKYNAYFGLYSSATHIVSNPRVCVIPDYNIKATHKVDWVEEGFNNDTVVEKDVKLELNLFDGMGIMSPDLAKKWAEELGINDYIPSAFCLRNGFIKGMCCVFDFHAFGEKIAEKYNIVNDVWEKPISDIRNYDLILTESQFKLWSAYKNYKEYEDNCKENDLFWGVSRVSPKVEKKYSTTNYQFVQSINLSDDSDIKNLCKPTVDWIEDILGVDIMKSILFLSGNSIEDMVDGDILDIKKINNDMVKALILNNNIINDPYIKNKIYQYIKRKIKDSYIAKLIIPSNFQVMISDPYALCEYIFGFSIVKGLLQDKQHYSAYWSNQNINKVVGMRSPLTWRSEVNILNLQKNDETDEWYKHLDSGIIYNIHGVDTMLAADSDFDYDLVMTTNSNEFINNSYGGLPITYKKNTTKKGKINEDTLFLSDLYSFNSQIGMVTNYSTTMYCMLSEYEEDSDEYKELIQRLKICRKEQGSQIDKAKGILVKDFPINWVREQKILDTDSEEIIEKKEFENKLVIKKKPYFMRWLYKNYNKTYQKFENNANTYCEVNFRCDFKQLKDKNFKTEKEQQYLDKHLSSLPLNESDCQMNRLSKYMESIKYNFDILVNRSDKFDYTILTDKNIKVLENDLYKKVENIYHSFVANKHLHASISENDNLEAKDKYDDISYGRYEEMLDSYQKKLRWVGNNVSLITNIAVDICYRKYPKSNKDFVWKLCTSGLMKNIYNNRQKNIYIPIKDENGDITYLYENYKMNEVKLLEDTQ